MTEISLRQTLTEEPVSRVKKESSKTQVSQTKEAPPLAPPSTTTSRLNPKEQLEQERRQEVVGIEAPKDETNLNNSSETIYNQIDQIVNQKSQK